MARFNLLPLHKTWTHKQALVFLVLAISAVWLLTYALAIVLPPTLALQVSLWVPAFWLVVWLALAFQIIAARGGGTGDQIMYLTAILVLSPISILIVPVLWYLLVRYVPHKRENDQLSNLEIAALLNVPLTVARLWGKLDFSDVASRIGLSAEYLITLPVIWGLIALLNRKPRMETHKNSGG